MEVLDRLKDLVCRRPIAVISVVFFLSSLVTGPVDPAATKGGFFLQVGPLFFGRPIAIWGDTPHYLVLVNSLIEDGDFDILNNYQQAREGDWDTGTRTRGRPLNRHADIDSEGRALLTHPPFLPMLLSLIVWPLQSTQWVESACIWLTMGSVILALALLKRIPGWTPAWPLLAALATPLWCYCRDVWTDTWLILPWVLILAFPKARFQVPAILAGVWIKYSFAVVPMAFAIAAAWRRDWKRALFFSSWTAISVLTAIGFTQYLFADVDHFSLFHIGVHQVKLDRSLLGPFGIAPLAGIGLLIAPRNGILPFSPFLAAGLRRLLSFSDLYFPALAFFGLHCFFLGWMAGSGFSARYLVPMLPIMVFASLEGRIRWTRLFAAAVAFGLTWCGLAGVLPALVYDRNILEIIWAVLFELGILDSPPTMVTPI